MPYDYERTVISKATGLTGVEAEHIAQKLKEENIDPQTIDWHGAISDARDYGSRYAAVKKYLADYYGISLITTGSMPDIIPASYDIAALESQSATKQGVKNLLKTYYSTNSKQKKEEIKEMLLTDAPLHNVLMTAMYNGLDLPNARRFLNEVMKEEVIDFVKAPVTREVKIQKIIEKPVEEIVEKPVVVQKPEVKPKVKSIQETYEAIKAKQKEASVQELQAFGERLQPEQPTLEKKPTAADLVRAGFIKEGQRWKKLITTRQTPKKGSMAALRSEVYKLRLANLPLQLQLERQRLLMRREQMEKLTRLLGQRQKLTSVQQALNLLGFMPMQPAPGPLVRPGYYVEARPKLPVGFRWKKLPKGKKGSKQTVSDVAICARCNVPMVLMPNMFGQLIWRCPVCGGSHFRDMYV